MIALIRAELWRVSSRRFFRTLFLLAFAAVAVVGVWVFVSSGEARDFAYESSVHTGFRISASILFTASVVVGASAVGAEWGAGVITTLLTWEPRRGRLMLGKGVATIAAVVVATLAIFVLIGLVMLPSGTLRGTMDGLTASWWWSTMGLAARGSAAVALGTALGVGLANVMRTAAGPIAAWMIFQFVVAPLLAFFWRPGLYRWFPDGNVQLLVGGFEDSSINGVALLPSVSALRGGLVLAAYAGAVLIAGFASFRARDVN
ncbi:MAG: ABC transporter permease [Actinomycetota bacterium]